MDLGLPITGDLLPFMVFVLSHGFLGMSGVLQADTLGVVFISPSSDLWSGSGDEPFSAILLLLANRALISSISPPPPGRGPFPLASDLAPVAPVMAAARAAPASSLLGTLRSLAPARAAARPERGRSSAGENSPVGRGGAGGGGGAPGGGPGGGGGVPPGVSVGGSGGGGGGGGWPAGVVGVTAGVAAAEFTVEPGGRGGGGGGVGVVNPEVCPTSWGWG